MTYTTYIQGADGGATQLPNHLTAQRAPATQIIKAAEQEITDSDALAPLLQQLLRQTMPNWQQAQRQQQQQQQQHFFVFENSQPVQLAGQQPQILQEFNGVNVRQPQQQQQQPQSTYMPQRQQQQFTQLPIQMQQQQAEQKEYTQYLQTAPKIALAPPATATAATPIPATPATPAAAAAWPHGVRFVAPIGSWANSFQPP